MFLSPIPVLCTPDTGLKLLWSPPTGQPRGTCAHISPVPTPWCRAAGPASTPRRLRGSCGPEEPRGGHCIASAAAPARAGPVTEHLQPFNSLLGAKGSLPTAEPCAAPSPLPRWGTAPRGLAGATQPLSSTMSLNHGNAEISPPPHTPFQKGRVNKFTACHQKEIWCRCSPAGCSRVPESNSEAVHRPAEQSSNCTLLFRNNYQAKVNNLNDCLEFIKHSSSLQPLKSEPDASLKRDPDEQSSLLIPNANPWRSLPPHHHRGQLLFPRN